MTLPEIKAAVARLSREEFEAFSKWFSGHLANRWDERIEKDARAGRFEAAGERAKADYEAGRCTQF